ncbi:MAG: hypothetical protein ACYDAG_05020, partial [Chloroflexota bacterium]
MSDAPIGYVVNEYDEYVWHGYHEGVSPMVRLIGTLAQRAEVIRMHKPAAQQSLRRKLMRPCSDEAVVLFLAYEHTEVTARQTASEAKGMAIKAYNKAIMATINAYNEAMSPIEDAYTAAKNLARQSYDEAKVSAKVSAKKGSRRTYGEARAAAKKAHDEATAPIKDAYMASMTDGRRCCAEAKDAAKNSYRETVAVSLAPIL